MVARRRRIIGAALRAGACAALLFFDPALASEEIFRFRIDPGRSYVRFDGETTLHNLDGEAHKFRGEGGSPKSLYGPGVTARVTIEAASINTGNFLRDWMMRKNTLRVEKYPEIVFHVDGVAPVGDPSHQKSPMKLILKGRLNLRGVVRERSFPVTVERLEKGFVVSGRFPIKMSEHLIPDPSLFFNKVRDELISIFKFTAVPIRKGATGAKLPRE